MPEFDVWFAGDEEQGFAADSEDAMNCFDMKERVSASGEGEAVFEFNKAIGEDPLPTERYFIQRVVPQPVYVADVTVTDEGLPIIQARPSL